MCPHSTKGLSEARRVLRGLQAKQPTRPRFGHPKPRTSTTDSALASLDRRKDFTPTNDPKIVKRGGFKFDLEQETRRIALAEDLIRRIDPGPFEDPHYLALLAYQAASIEMALPASVKSQGLTHDWSQFLLGTIHSPELNAFAQRIRRRDFTVVVLYSALIEFNYQAAKALVAAQHPVSSSEQTNQVTFSSSEEHIAEQLERDSEPVERLYRTLEAYFFAGYPRAFFHETVPPNHVIPLSLLVDLSERWIMAHEFGHGFAGRYDFRQAPDSPARAEEYFADTFATIHTCLSAATLDAVVPELALIGGTFALACLDVFKRGLHVARYGRVLPTQGDAEHPPNKARVFNILDAFDYYFEVAGAEPGPNIDFSLVFQPRGAIDKDAARKRHEPALEFANALFVIWDQVEPRLRRDFESKRPLHPMWG
jgi:hypothetical protein